MAALAASRSAGTPLAALALAAAAIVVTELVQVSGDSQSLDPLDAQPFSFSSPVHLAIVVVLGAWPAAVLAGLGVLVVDCFRDAPRRAIAFNASAFVLATAAAGAVFGLAGGTAGSVRLPGELPAFGLLALVYLLVNLVLVNGIVALHSGGSFLAELRDVLRTDPSSRAAEAGLGLLFAVCVLYQPWALVPCVPLVLVVYRAYERLAALRRETARALETFANVVDERDPSTFRHSARVAAHVVELAQGLGLPSSAVQRLQWAGRLHDLGKIAVDAQVLNKRGALNPQELAAMRRHARLSARLLRRFRFASSAARAVEYHHERFDGNGYYGVGPEHVPLAAHMLVIADSFDAMTSDRSYRKALPTAAALEEVERASGSQFHPGLARAFVALQRGEDPRGALSDEEARELRALRRAERPPASPLSVIGDGMTPGALTAVAGLAGALTLAGAGVPLLALPALGLSVAGVAWAQTERRRARRLTRELDILLSEAVDREGALSGLAGALAARSADWIGIVRWRSEDLVASLGRQWRLDGSVAPSAEALTSWLLRDADETDTITAHGYELGRRGWLVALPLASGTAPATEFLVVAFAGPRRRWVELALRDTRPRLGDALKLPADREHPLRLAAVS